jgi:PhzF family phenazine biosynthesis protein
MMRLFQVDAFASKPFRGNPAAVVPLQTSRWPPDSLLQSIAAENNLSETAFLLAADGTDEAARHRADYHLRWFTPALEVELCGHATLASAHVLFNHLLFQPDTVVFWTLSGGLSVARGERDLLVMNFPSVPIEPMPIDARINEALGIAPREMYRASRGVTGQAVNWLAVFDEAQVVRDCRPDFRELRSIGDGYLCITAPGDSPDVNFVSRYFAPAGGIDEDPVTGSTHCMLTPFWSKRLEKKELRALQISKRGGELFCKDCGERVEIAGRAVTYLEGEIRIGLR